MSSLYRTTLFLTCMACAAGGGYWFGKQSQSSIAVDTESPPETQPSALPALSAETKTAQDPEAPLKALIAQGRSFSAIDWLEDRLLQDPNNSRLRFLLADLLDQTQQPSAAIQQLLTIRALSLNSAELQRARLQIDAIADRADQRYQASRQTQAALSFFQDLIVKEPNYDRHRLLLSQWLLRSGDLATAERLLRETGLNGVSQAELDSALAEIRTRQQTLPIERRNGAMFADVTVRTPRGDHTLNLLLDTGATLTAISIFKLREIEAVRTDYSIKAQTANGIVELPVYRLDRLEAGPVTLSDVAVAGLLEPGINSDGLLGLDVLDQLPHPISTAEE